MSHRTTAQLWTPLFLVTAFAATLSALAVRDRIEAPSRLVVEAPTPPPVLVLAAR
jgi:hypothetical protein